MDLVTIYKTNFTIFIGIFVTLAVMGTTTLYDRYRSKGGASFKPENSKFLSNLNQKVTAFGSECLEQFSQFGKKLSSLIRNKFGSSQEKPSSAQKRSNPVQDNSGENNLDKVKTIFLKAKDAGQKFFVSFRNKVSSFSSSLPRKKNKEKFVPLSDDQKEELKSSVTDRANALDKAVESKKDSLNFDDDLLTKMSTSNTLTGSSPELKATEPSPGEASSDLDMSFDNNFKIDDNEFAIKVDGLDNEPAENNSMFSENTAEIKFGEEKDNLLDSLKKDIVVKKEKKINFMDNMQGENLDLKLIKTDLEGILKELKKYEQYSKS